MSERSTSELRPAPCEEHETIVVITNTNSNTNAALPAPMANGLVGTGFASQYRLQPRADF